MTPESRDGSGPGPRATRFEVDGVEHAVISYPMRRAAGVSNLTRAELQVLDLMIDGRSNRDIASSRGTSPRTVANQVASIFRKLGVSSRIELVSLLLSLPEP